MHAHLSYTIPTNSSTTCMIRGFLQDSSQLSTTACMHMNQTPAHDKRQLADHAPHA
jgi:hypothetical protein